MPALFLTIPENPPERVDKALAEAAPDDAALSRSRLSKLIAEGAVHGPAGPVRDGKAKVIAGETYRIELGEPAPVETLPEAIPLDVAYEDDELIVIDKSAGMVVHPAPGSPTGTLVNALLAHCGLGLIGDPVYGGARRASARALGPAAAQAALAFPRQALHAASLGFSHPVTGIWLDFESPLPDDMKALLESLRAGTPVP